jgi:hypothetical protein
MIFLDVQKTLLDDRETILFEGSSPGTMGTVGTIGTIPATGVAGNMAVTVAVML